MAGSGRGKWRSQGGVTKPKSHVGWPHNKDGLLRGEEEKVQRSLLEDEVRDDDMVGVLARLRNFGGSGKRHRYLSVTNEEEKNRQ